MTDDREKDFATRLLESPKFHTLVEKTEERYRRTGHLKELRHFLHIFRTLPVYRALLEWLCARHGLNYAWSKRDGRLVLGFSESRAHPNASLRLYLEQYQESLSDMQRVRARERKRIAEQRKQTARQKRQAAETRGRTSKPVAKMPKAKGRLTNQKARKTKRRSKDALDYAVPGSFGTGRRR